MKNYHSKKKDNYIEGKITITDFYVNKDVKIIGSFEKDGTDCYSIKNDKGEVMLLYKPLWKTLVNNKIISSSTFAKLEKNPSKFKPI